MKLWVARQPIFGVRINLVAYELLYRSGTVNAFDQSEENAATAKVITASFYSPGGREILGEKPAFINFPSALLAGGEAALLPPADVVIEILESVKPDLNIMLACHDLRARGYQLALDDFVPTQEANALTEIANYIKVDFRATSPKQQREVVSRLGKSACLLAEKIETMEEFERAREMGYTLFQGYFFARPIIVSTREVPVFKLNRLRILQQLQLEEMDFAAMSQLIQQDSTLSYKLLRFANSALFCVRKPMESIRQAMVLIGELGMRRWLAIVLLTDMTSDKPAELATNALTRARFCELLGPEAGMAQRSGDLFLLGLFSHLDAMYGRPIDELLRGLNLREDIAETLLGSAGSENRVANLWKTVLAYEQGDWDGAAATSRAAGIENADIPQLYGDAVRWADQVIHGGDVQAEPTRTPHVATI